jgi:hypothetical protein
LADSGSTKPNKEKLLTMSTNFASYFKTGRREGGEAFSTLVDDRPDWLQEAVREAHQGTLPHDWIYAECRAAVESFVAGDLDDEDSVHEFAEGRVDVYTKNLYQWAADFCLTETFGFAEQEARDMGLPEETERRLACIQYAALRHIADVMFRACTEAADEASAAAELEAEKAQS